MTSAADPRIDHMLEILLAFARQDFSKRAPISDSLDEVDALAAGLNMLAEELDGAVASRRELEAAYRALREAQAKLVHSGKLVAIGQLASGAAHEINNPASWVTLSHEVLSRRLSELRAVLPQTLTHDSAAAARRILQEAEAALNDAQNGMERIRDVSGDSRLFSRSDGEELEAVCLNEAVESAHRLAGPTLRAQARVDLRLETPGPGVRGNRGRLAQVVTNLLVNAAQAQRATDAELRISVSTWVDKAEAVLWVDDSGTGVPVELRERIFEPFFTTKPAGAGTGLGLSLVAEIVHRLGGTVGVGDSPLGGARFEVRLPAIQPAPSEDPARATLTDPPADRLKILIVDDEPRLLRTYALLLSEDHDVRCAPGGAQALDALAQDPRVDVVLCDLQMPGVDGVAVYQQAVKRDPSLGDRFLFSTGGGVLPRVKDFVATTRLPILEKPVRFEKLQAAIMTVGTRGRRPDLKGS